MATIGIKQARAFQFGGMAQYGNVTTLRFALLALASGAIAESTSDAAPAVGDKIDLGSLPAGFVIEDVQVIVSTGLSAGVKGSLGFAYSDGQDDPDLPQDAAYLGAALALDTAARLRLTTTKPPLPLAKEARLILTISGAANAKAGQVDIVLHGERMGAR